MPQYVSTDPNFGLPSGPQYVSTDPNYGAPARFPGQNSELRQGKPESAWHQAWESARNAIFGSPEREEIKSTGVGLQPTPAELADTAWQGAMLLGGPEAGIGALQAVRGPIGAAGRFLATHPKATGAVIGAVPGALHGDPEAAFYGAGAGAAMGEAAERGMRGLRGIAARRAAAEAPAVARVVAPPVVPTDPKELMRQVGSLVSAGKHEEAQALVDAVRAQAAAAAEAVPVAAVAKAAPKATADELKAFAGEISGPKPPAPKVEPKPAPAAPEPKLSATDAYVKRFMSGEGAKVGNDPGAQRLMLGANRLENAGRHSEAQALAAAARATKPNGRAVAQAHNELMAFAKDIAARNPKAGEKIWILLDDAGKPVKWITPDQAGAAARKGQKTTWIKNLWGSPAAMFRE